MTNNYQEPEVFEVGRAQEIVLGAPKGTGFPDSVQDRSPGADIDESDD
jgi:hypothetical protein